MVPDGAVNIPGTWAAQRKVQVQAIIVATEDLVWKHHFRCCAVLAMHHLQTRKQSSGLIKQWLAAL